MSLSFQEKSLWLVLITLVLCTAGYLGAALTTVTPSVEPGRLQSFVGVLVGLVVLQVTGHVLLALGHRRELAASVQSDERDVLIRLRSTAWGSHVLATGVFVSLCVAAIVPGNFAFMHVLLGFWVLAQAVQLASQLVLYRRGI